MLAVATLLLIVCLGTLTSRSAKVLAILIALSAPTGWLLYQHHASGRYALGTSLDGLNLHMGNNPSFLRDYPPHMSLDDTANELNRGQYFADEWALSDYHKKAAITFIRDYPVQTAHGVLRKLRILFFSMERVGAWTRHGLMFLIETSGMVLFRLLFWTSLAVSTFVVLKSKGSLRRAGAIYLLLVGAVFLPYILGFGYTRHVSVLIYPTVIFCCSMLQTCPSTSE